MVCASALILHRFPLDLATVAAYIPPVYERDRLGRPLILPRESALACAPVITVRMDAGNKVYEPEARPEEFLAADAPVEDELVAEVLR